MDNIAQPVQNTPPVIPVPAASFVPPVTPSAPTAGSKKPLIIVLSIIGALVLVAGAVFLGSKFLIKEDLSRYDKDADSDGIPDFIETELGYNPNSSELERCKQNSCKESVFGKKNNVLIILDGSGSMDIKSGGQSRMDIAKQAIKMYISKVSTDANVGLMVYGNKGSNSVGDKAISCASAEVVAPMGSVTSSSVDSYLAGIRPVGWTPMGLAIRKAALEFVGKQGSNNIILVTDGDETCDSDPVGAARAAFTSADAVKVSVIGYAVDNNTQVLLNSISMAGGGKYSFASDADQLAKSFNTLYDDYKALNVESKCRADAFDQMLTCYGTSGVTGKVVEYVNTKLSDKNKKVSKAEFDKLVEVQDRMYNLQDKARSEGDSLKLDLEQKRQKIDF